MQCGKSISEKQEACDFCGSNQLSSLISEGGKEEKTPKVNNQKYIDKYKNNDNLVECIHCKEEIAKTAFKCPHCGGLKRFTNKALIKLFLLVMVGTCAYSGGMYFMRQKCVTDALEIGLNPDTIQRTCDY
jgi:RNA polymerase subunit RPABC4/transcription elongation factor Spt4